MAITEVREIVRERREYFVPCERPKRLVSAADVAIPEVRRLGLAPPPLEPPPLLAAFQPVASVQRSWLGEAVHTAGRVLGINRHPSLHGAAVLFDKEKLAPDYGERMRLLDPRDWIAVGDDQFYKLRALAGHGSTTLIYTLDDDRVVIRLPISNGRWHPDLKATHADLITEFIEAHALLSAMGVTVPRLMASAPGKFAVVERVRCGMTVKDMLDSHTLGHAERAEMERALVDFARQVAPFARIGDFHEDQVRWDPSRKRWILLDWMGLALMKPGFIRSNGAWVASKQLPFDHWFGNGRIEKVPHLAGEWLALRERLNQATMQERKHMLEKPAAVDLLMRHPDWTAR